MPIVTIIVPRGVGAVSMAVVDPSYRLLACQYLREQLEVLMRELLGVRRNEEIEPVHQARVASRRVRAALRMFADCFDAKKVATMAEAGQEADRENWAPRATRTFRSSSSRNFSRRWMRRTGSIGQASSGCCFDCGRAGVALQSEVVDMLDKLEKTGHAGRNVRRDGEEPFYAEKPRGADFQPVCLREGRRPHSASGRLT